MALYKRSHSLKTTFESFDAEIFLRRAQIETNKKLYANSMTNLLKFILKGNREQKSYDAIQADKLNALNQIPILVPEIEPPV